MLVTDAFDYYLIMTGIGFLGGMFMSILWALKN